MVIDADISFFIRHADLFYVLNKSILCFYQLFVGGFPQNTKISGERWPHKLDVVEICGNGMLGWVFHQTIRLEIYIHLGGIVVASIQLCRVRGGRIWHNYEHPSYSWHLCWVAHRPTGCQIIFPTMAEDPTFTICFVWFWGFFSAWKILELCLGWENWNRTSLYIWW